MDDNNEEEDLLTSNLSQRRSYYSNNNSRKSSSKSLQHSGQTIINNPNPNPNNNSFSQSHEHPLGIIPPSNIKQHTKYKEVHGRPASDQLNVDNNTNPENPVSHPPTPHQSSRIQSTRKHPSRLNSQSNDYASTQRSFNNDNNTNNGDDPFGKDEEFDQLDVLTKQALHQVKDNISNFKTDVTSLIQDIREKQNQGKCKGC